VAKSAAKPAVKAAAKAPAKSVKAPAKPVVKAKAAAKPAVKAKPSSSAKAAPKTVSKAVAKPSKAVPVAKPASKSVSVAAAKAAAVAPAKVMKSAPQPAAPSVSPSMLTPPPPLKPGRRSSARATAHMPPPAPMVPTHAPDAAKASYSTISLPVISPPPHVAAKKDPKLANNWKTKEANALTDEEVKAMPDSEYMNDKQLAFFRHKLSLLKQEIHASAGETTEHLREDTAVVPDPADRATIEEEHALELRTRDRERKLLKKIEQSISRIDAGDYGYCDETGEAIGVGRLIARPTASLSLEAQQRRELKQKMFGD
jgi:DnaK suppressor protein